jgi:hypothetical protein
MSVRHPPAMNYMSIRISLVRIEEYALLCRADDLKLVSFPKLTQKN